MTLSKLNSVPATSTAICGASSEVTNLRTKRLDRSKRRRSNQDQFAVFAESTGYFKRFLTIFCCSAVERSIFRVFASASA